MVLSSQREWRRRKDPAPLPSPPVATPPPCPGLWKVRNKRSLPLSLIYPGLLPLLADKGAFLEPISHLKRLPGRGENFSKALPEANVARGSRLSDPQAFLLSYHIEAALPPKLSPSLQGESIGVIGT